jgi:hypothetical protein
MPRRRQLVLVKPAEKPGDSAPLGSVRQVRDTLGRFNTASDGSIDPAGGLEVLHGPGLTCELASAVEPVKQVLVTVTDEDIAWPVLSRLCKAAQWKMMDIDTGRTFG